MSQVESPAAALTVHGGRLDAAAARFPDASAPWIDLSTGINPHGYDDAALAQADPSRLPAPALLRALEDAAAAAFGMAAGAIAALPGSEIGLRLLATLDLPGPARRVATPCYSTHNDALPGAVAVDHADIVAGAPGGTVLLANPNNPDGRIIAPERLLHRADAGLVVVDEAFADATPEASVLPHLRGGDRVAVFRSFGKFYGLAGVRLGFVCGTDAVVEPIRARLGAWPVSSAAIAVGIAAYRDVAWQAETRRRVTQSADALDAVLRRHGLDPVGACPLFRLVETGVAPAIFDRLGRAGILVRPFADAPRRLRFGLPRDAAALDRVDQALGDR